MVSLSYYLIVQEGIYIYMYCREPSYHIVHFVTTLIPESSVILSHL